MIKLPLYGIGTEGDFTYLLVKKHPQILQWLAILLEDVFGIPKAHVMIQDEDPDHGIVERTTKELVDLHDSFHAEKSRIDVFYGNEKVFITVICSAELRPAFLSKVQECTIWMKPGE